MGRQLQIGVEPQRGGSFRSVTPEVVEGPVRQTPFLVVDFMSWEFVEGIFLTFGFLNLSLSIVNLRRCVMLKQLI